MSEWHQHPDQPFSDGFPEERSEAVRHGRNKGIALLIAAGAAAATPALLGLTARPVSAQVWHCDNFVGPMLRPLPYMTGDGGVECTLPNYYLAAAARNRLYWANQGTWTTQDDKVAYDPNPNLYLRVGTVAYCQQGNWKNGNESWVTFPNGQSLYQHAETGPPNPYYYCY